jgi:phytanoyl-CoA hydroxylase
MGGLTAEQLNRFDDEGYLVVEDIIDPEKYLEPMVRDYQVVLDNIMQDLYIRGEISSTYADLEFGQRLTRLYIESGRDWANHFDFSLPLRREIRPDEPCFFEPSVFNVLRNPDLLDAIESLIGPEIYSNPVQHVRLKPPESAVPKELQSGRGLVVATPWHQDASVVADEADNTTMITVWIPIVDATEENGCLQVVPNNHRQGLIEHCATGATAPTDGRKTLAKGTYLSTNMFDADRARPVPMKRGSAILMSRYTPHGSLSNNSGSVRWSMDLRYTPTGMPTGRPEFPGFVARSRRDPSTELRDAAAWKQSWLDTRDRYCSQPGLVKNFTRSWTGEGCA